MTDAYEVGYRKPPRQHQFKPGKSGNPRGRPKATRKAAPVIRIELTIFIDVGDAKPSTHPRSPESVNSAPGVAG